MRAVDDRGCGTPGGAAEASSPMKLTEPHLSDCLLQQLFCSVFMSFVAYIEVSTLRCSETHYSCEKGKPLRSA